MKCKHLNTQDLGTHWRCSDCGLVAKKNTIGEAIDKIEDLLRRLDKLEAAGIDVSANRTRVDNIISNVELQVNHPYKDN